MNTPAFQCFVFISVMVVVVYSASVQNDPNEDKCVALCQIKNATEHLLKLNLHGWVPKISKDKCTNEFFCLAEKALGNITEPKNVSEHNLEYLRRRLHSFNNKTKETHCELPTVNKTRYQLPDFLKNVNHCTGRVLLWHKCKCQV